MRVAIVGAGLSGLTTAALLARRGHDVVLLEATWTLGGLAAPRELGPHRFCPGPQYLWGMAADGPGRQILEMAGVTTSMRAVDPGFERVIIGEPGQNDAVDTVVVDGMPRCGLSEGGVSMATVLDRLGRCGEVIGENARFTRSGAAMLRAVASSSSVSLGDKAALLSHHDDTIAALAHRTGATPRDVRLLLAEQLIFAEPLFELSSVLFAAARHWLRQVHVPTAGVARFVDDLIAAVVAADVDVRLGAPVCRVEAAPHGIRLEVSGSDDEALIVDRVVWCCSPAVVRRLIPLEAHLFAPSAAVHCLCLDLSLDDDDARALRDHTLLWFQNDDDVTFPMRPPTSTKTPLAALNILSPSLNAHVAGARQVVCAYAPSGTSEHDIIARVRSLFRHHVEVHGTLSIDQTRWNEFGPGSDAVYGRRKTVAQLQRSVVDALPRRMSMAHAGAGIPGVLGCLQMAAAVADEVDA